MRYKVNKVNKVICRILNLMIPRRNKMSTKPIRHNVRNNFLMKPTTRSNDGDSLIYLI